MNFSDFYEQVHTPDAAKWEGIPRGSLQWKGTDACIDLHCECGAQSHLDGDFIYHFECDNCGRKYALSSYVALIPLTIEQAKFVSDGNDCAFRSEANS